jgi:hypothetical protein
VDLQRTEPETVVQTIRITSGGATGTRMPTGKKSLG